MSKKVNPSETPAKPQRATRIRRRVSIADIAKASGVSSAVVSYVINAGPRPVHVDTRERVLKAMRDLNYRPSAVVSGHASQRMDTIGIAFPRPDPELVTSPFYAAINAGILTEALQFGQNTLTYSGCFKTDIHRNLRIYADGRCDGLILITPPSDSELIPALKERGIPFVQILDSRDDPDVATVDVDDAAGAYEMTIYLLGLGHRRIAFFAGDENLAATSHRLNAFYRAHDDAGLPVDFSLVRHGRYKKKSGYDLAKAVLTLDNRPTALYCSNDESATGAMDALREMGLSVPGDISVVGTDDIDEAKSMTPPLTTVRQPLREMGKTAVQMLLDIVNGIESPRRIVMPATAVIRESTAPPK